MSIPVLLTVLYLLPLIAATKNSPPYTATEIIFLNCGASSNSTSQDGRHWDADSHSKFLPSSPFTSTTTQQFQNPATPQIPYSTARLFNSTVSYIFPLSPGPKFLRLHFNPSSNYSNFNPTNSFFSVKANNYTLLHNFNALFTVSAIRPPVDFLVKEFIIVVDENQKLNITINPSPNSTAFINGIEIVSMPDRLYAGRVEIPVKLVGTEQFLYLDNSYAFETVYRVNVGGSYIHGMDDTGMFRNWLPDSDFINVGALGMVSESPHNVTIKYTANTPAYIVPESVYRTRRSMGSNPQVNLNYNLTWVFSVDPGFTYLVRLHFCETGFEIQNVGDEVFSIFINNQTADDQIDVIFLSGGNSFPVYKDYAVLIPKESRSNRDLWLALRPKRDSSSKTYDAILNGLEILKLSNSTGSLAGSNLLPIEAPPSLQRKTKAKSDHMKLIIIIGSVISAVLTIFIFTFLFIYKQRDASPKTIKAKSFNLPIPFISRLNTRTHSLKPHNHFRKFSLFDIQVATGTFDDEFVIGSGGFGNVYKGLIDDGLTPVAIKRLHSSSKQGAREFKTEIQLLSELHHENLVSLIGYCDDPGEMILVYEYIQRGTLRDHLYKTKNPPLEWKTRLEICIGAARGLHYLHTGAKHPIIHRDVKSTNILVNEDWVAKVSDFGLSRTGPTTQSQTHVSTVVRGSFGYVDPEYYRRQRLTEKSDVFSFGVVLFEVLCARPAVIPGLPRERVNLCDWGRICYRRGALGKIMDANLVGDIDPVCLGKFGEIAESCLRDRGEERPTMSDVVMGLELALHLQETAEKNRVRVSTGIEDQESPLLISREVVVNSTATATDGDDDDDLFSGSCVGKEESGSTISSAAQSDPERFRSCAVFSEIGNEKGR